MVFAAFTRRDAPVDEVALLADGLGQSPRCD